MSEISVNWITSANINPEDANLPVRQVYGWVISRDSKVALVSKDNQRWQFPGGKPEPSESSIETLNREVREETGIDLSKYPDTMPRMFGYRRVNENGNQYLQLRFLAVIGIDSSSLELRLDEDTTQDEADIIRYIGWFSLSEAEKAVPWLKDADEYKALKAVL